MSEELKEVTKEELSELKGMGVMTIDDVLAMETLKIDYEPINGRLLVAVAKSQQRDGVIIPNQYEKSIETIAIGKILRVSKGITNFQVGDWIEFQKGAVMNNVSNIFDITHKPFELKDFFLIIIKTDIVFGKITFNDDDYLPPLISLINVEKEIQRKRNNEELSLKEQYERERGGKTI